MANPAHFDLAACSCLAELSRWCREGSADRIVVEGIWAVERARAAPVIDLLWEIHLHGVNLDLDQAYGVWTPDGWRTRHHRIRRERIVVPDRANGGYREVWRLPPGRLTRGLLRAAVMGCRRRNHAYYEQDVIGYPVLQLGRTRHLHLDIDYATSVDPELRRKDERLLKALGSLLVPGITGFHAYLYFKEPVPTDLGRNLVASVAEHLTGSVDRTNLGTYPAWAMSRREWLPFPIPRERAVEDRLRLPAVLRDYFLEATGSRLRSVFVDPHALADQLGLRAKLKAASPAASATPLPSPPPAAAMEMAQPELVAVVERLIESALAADGSAVAPERSPIWVSSGRSRVDERGLVWSKVATMGAMHLDEPVGEIAAGEFNDWLRAGLAHWHADEVIEAATIDRARLPDRLRRARYVRERGHAPGGVARALSQGFIEALVAELRKVTKSRKRLGSPRSVAACSSKRASSRATDSSSRSRTRWQLSAQPIAATSTATSGAGSGRGSSRTVGRATSADTTGSGSQPTFLSRRRSACGC